MYKIVNLRDKWAAIEIPRCGCSTLKTIAYRSVLNKEPKGNIHSLLGYTPESSNGIIVPYETDTSDIYNFAVIRNPLTRLISTWKSFTQDKPEAGFEDAYGLTFKQFVSFVLDYSMEYRFDNINPHIRPQHKFIGDCKNLVLLENLDSFLYWNFGYVNIEHKASSDIIEVMPTIDDYSMYLVSKIYRKDYEIVRNLVKGGI